MVRGSNNAGASDILRNQQLRDVFIDLTVARDVFRMASDKVIRKDQCGKRLLRR